MNSTKEKILQLHFSFANLEAVITAFNEEHGTEINVDMVQGHMPAEMFFHKSVPDSCKGWTGFIVGIDGVPYFLNDWLYNRSGEPYKKK